MKRVRIVPEEQNNKRRFRWYHVLICSILIAVVFTTMSVGLGYARYTIDTTPLESQFSVKGSVFRYADTASESNPAFVVEKRVPGEDTVLVSKDNNVKVTVPATAAGTQIDNAEYFLLKFTKMSVDKKHYERWDQQNQIDYVVTLCSISFDTDAGQTPVVTDSQSSITLELNVGHNADLLSITPEDQYAAHAYDAETGYLKFTGLSGISGATGTYSVGYNTTTPTPDTSWYNASYGTFIINSAEALAGVAKLVNDGTTDFAGKVIKLGDDISLYNQDGSKYTWDPIGNDHRPFKGSFDGDGHTITGLNLRVFYNTIVNGDENESKDRTCGMFGEAVGDGSNYIKNLTLKDVSYSEDMDVYRNSDEGQAYGSLVGYTSGVNISNVHVDGLNVYGRAKYIGGILGRGDSNGSLSDCSVENAVFDVNEADYVGGIVAIQFGNGEDALRNCYVSAQINGDYNIGAGGIVGLAFGHNGAVGIENCYFTGTFAPTDEQAKCGGIVGLAASAVDKDYVINNCYCDCGANLLGYGYFGYHVDVIQDRTYEEEQAMLGSHIVIENSSWSNDNDRFEWKSYASDMLWYEGGNAEKAGGCLFTAGMSYQQFLDAFADGTPLTVVPATEAPTEAPTVVNTPTEQP